MSKPKQKEKKTDAQIEVEKRCQELMSQLIDKDHMLKKAQEKCMRLGVDLYEAKTEASQLKNYIKDQFEKLTLTNENLKNRLTQLTGNKNQLEIQLATIKAKLQFERKQHQEWRREKQKDFQDVKRHYATQLGRYELQATEYAVSINERNAMMNERSHLLQMIEEERQDFKKRLADRDRDKIQALDTLKKEMKDKFKDMKGNLLSIRREQLDNNTRLTLLQNHQLIQELEYQSINTEKVLQKNAQMEAKIKQLETQILIRDQVEKEVAKRSVISKKMLKTFQEKAQALEQENEDLARQRKLQKQQLQSEEKNSIKLAQLMKALQAADLRIQSLEKQLSAKSIQAKETAKNVDAKKDVNSNLTNLLLFYYEKCISKSKQLQNKNQILDVQALKDKEVKDWKQYQMQKVIEVLLSQLKKHLTPAHLDSQTWRKLADSRIAKLKPQQKENFIMSELKNEVKCDTKYIRSLSLEKNKLFYQNKRKLSSKNGRSLTKIAPDHSVSFGRYVQGNLRQWGPEIKPPASQSLAERFMKPMKNKLK